MLATLVTAAVTLLVGVGSTWLSIGGRERRARNTIRDELDLADRLGEHTERGQQLRGIAEERLDWYIRRNDQRLDRWGAHLGAGITNVVGAVITLWLVIPKVDSVREGVFVGSVIGLVFALTHAVVPPLIIRTAYRKPSK